MTIAQSMLPEFDHEMATTRALLERIPDDRAAFKAHAKSTAMGDLAAHVVSLASWAVPVVSQTEMDLNPPGGPGYTPPTFTSTAALLERFDANVRAAREHIGRTSDADLMVPWSLKNGGHAIFTMPRVAVLRTFFMNHIIHHRGQLSVYLRLNDVPLPSIYGPTADT
jgi:uncharacterized damage-inducible protein DinB